MPHKVKRKKRSRVSLLLIPAIIVIGLVAGVLIRHFYFSPHVTPNKSSLNNSKYNSTPAPTADNNPNNTRKANTTVTPTLENNTPSSSLSTNSGSFSVQINPTVTDNGSNIHVGTQVFGTTSGTCSLTASQTGQSTLQLGSTSVTQDVNIYDCGVFNIPSSSFPSPGTWKLTLTVTNASGSASGSENITF